MVASIDGSVLGQPAIATLKIRPAGGKFKYEARHLTGNEVVHASEYIREICADQNQIKITLQNNESYEALVTDQGFKLKVNFFLYIDFAMSEKQYHHVAKKLDHLQANGSQSVSPSQQSGVR